MSAEGDINEVPQTPVRSSSAVIWFAILGLTLGLLALRETAPWLIIFPDEWVVPIVSVLNAIMTWVVDTTGAFFRAVSGALDIPMAAVRNLLTWLPWSVSVFIIVVIAYAASGWKLAVFTAFSVSYMLVVGLWIESMNSLALVAVSVPLAVFLGFAIGTAGFFYPRAERAIMVTLDALQTIPAFAYLLPILLLFGFGVVN